MGKKSEEMLRAKERVSMNELAKKALEKGIGETEVEAAEVVGRTTPEQEQEKSE